MAWSGRRYRRNRRRRGRRRRWSCRRRRRNVERNGRTVERVQFIQAALPRLLGFSRRRGDVLYFIVLIGWKVLIGRFTEEGVPVGAVEIRELGWIGDNCSKPIVEGHMELRGDGSCLEVQHQGDRTRVPITHPHVHVALRSRLPSRDLLASRDSVIEDIDRAAPHVKIATLRLWPARAGEDVDGGEPILFRRHTIPNIDSVSDSHRPEL
jgi:hypothetical protein